MINIKDKQIVVVSYLEINTWSKIQSTNDVEVWQSQDQQNQLVVPNEMDTQQLFQLINMLGEYEGRDAWDITEEMVEIGEILAGGKRKYILKKPIDKKIQKRISASTLRGAKAIVQEYQASKAYAKQNGTNFSPHMLDLDRHAEDNEMFEAIKFLHSSSHVIIVSHKHGILGPNLEDMTTEEIIKAQPLTVENRLDAHHAEGFDQGYQINENGEGILTKNLYEITLDEAKEIFDYFHAHAHEKMLFQEKEIQLSLDTN